MLGAADGQGNDAIGLFDPTFSPSSYCGASPVITK